MIKITMCLNALQDCFRHKERKHFVKCTCNLHTHANTLVKRQFPQIQRTSATSRICFCCFRGAGAANSIFYLQEFLAILW